MANLLPVKKIYCDTKFKRSDSKSNSNFKIDLPQTLKLPDNAIFYIDDVSIPYVWHTVRAGVNDKMYFRLSDPTYILPDYLHADYTITLDSKTYNGTQFAAAIASKIQAITAGTATTCSYDTQTKLISISVSNYEFNLFTDAELIDPNSLYNIGWNDTAYDKNNLASANELLTNIFQPSPISSTTTPAEYYLMLTPVRNIYMRSPNLSSFNTIGCNGESSIIKKIAVNVGPGDMITSYITSSTDYLNCSRATWKTVEIQITDVNGSEIHMHGGNWSFSILLDIANPGI
jgi:hypothetical protein